MLRLTAFERRSALTLVARVPCQEHAGTPVQQRNNRTRDHNAAIGSLSVQVASATLYTVHTQNLYSTGRSLLILLYPHTPNHSTLSGGISALNTRHPLCFPEQQSKPIVLTTSRGTLTTQSQQSNIHTRCLRDHRTLESRPLSFTSQARYVFFHPLPLLAVSAH